MWKRLRRILFYSAVFGLLGISSVFISHEVFDFTSSNSAIYVLKGKDGTMEVARDLRIEDADRIVFMYGGVNRIFEYFMEGLASASNEPRLEVTWDEEQGRGEVKQFRPDGTMLLQTFARFAEKGGRSAHGLFRGGDVPYGDASRSPDGSTSGFAYFDGEDWIHIWCAANEGFTPVGTTLNIGAMEWEYLGSKVLKETSREVIIASEHRLEYAGGTVKMVRQARFRAGDDYYILRVGFSNLGETGIAYNYAYGDEPWVGNFGSSDGDVGWSENGLVERENYVPAERHGFAGYWDRGNPAAEEPFGYSGYANFIEWFEDPTKVFFSNSDECCDQSEPLDSKFNRLLMIAWFDQPLKPGETKYHTFAIGMAKMDPTTGFPVKPEVNLF